MFQPQPFSKDFIYLFLERGNRREKERERNTDVRNIDRLFFIHAPGGERTRHPGMCPNWGSNQQPFALQNNAQPTEPHQSGLASTLAPLEPHPLQKPGSQSLSPRSGDTPDRSNPDAYPKFAMSQARFVQAVLFGISKAHSLREP